MTREEAKAWFKVLLKDEYAFNSADREAFAMAIKALEQEPLEVEATELQKAHHKGFEDCRKAVLDIVDSYSESQSNVEDVTQDIISYVVALPPVNPQPCEDAISREDALMALTGEWTEITDEIIHRFIKRIKALPPVNPQPCEDAISREATLKPYKDLNDEDTISVWLIRKNIEQQPPVNPQPKMGWWIFDKTLDKHYYCSECKSMGVDYWDFCPYCGVKMIEPQESEIKE